ncbi:MAG: AMP-binding protein [Pseudomonadota bacterium]
MNKLWSSLCHHANMKPDEPAILQLQGPSNNALETSYTWRELQQAVLTLANALRADQVEEVALHADNGPAWIVADLACDYAGITLLPLPRFFSTLQLQHALDVVPVDVILTDNAPLWQGLTTDAWQPSGTHLGLDYLRNTTRQQAWSSRQLSVPPQTSKITFTSGSTGSPKGVCLSADTMAAVTSSILEATASCAIERHLCVLPLATLLENIAGVHAPLRRGAQVIVASEAMLGFNGNSGFSLPTFLAALSRCRPNSLILIPQLLEALVMSADAGWKCPDSLQFIAVGGATVSAALLERAWAHGLPVYEGYGLSECGSVVSLNTPQARRNGSLGKPLPHGNVAIIDGEIVVTGKVSLGYAGDRASWHAAAVARCTTGDLGYFDADGYLHFSGRRKNLLVSSFGRNISPEWVEAELSACPAIAQSFVFGDSRPYCVALIAARAAQVTDQQIEDCVTRVNASLPAYARIQRWQRLAAPLTRGTGIDSDLLTSNGRPRRPQIEQQFREQIDALYVAAPVATTTSNSQMERETP